MSGLRRKHKHSANSSSSTSHKKSKKSVNLAWKRNQDEDIESEEEVEYPHEEHSEEEEAETVDAKRVRLAREYLKRLEEAETGSTSESTADEDEKEEEGVEDEAPETLHDRIGRKLQRERQKRQGTLERAVARHVANDLAWMKGQITPGATCAEEEAKAWLDAGYVTYLRGHDLTATCVALQANGERALSGSKDNSVLLWDVEHCTRIAQISKQWKKSDMEEPKGNGEALSVACSDDGRYAAVGRRDATVQIYDIRLSGNKTNASLVTTFQGHKGPVTSLCFRTQSLQLFSGAEDRCIRHYSLDEMTYLETLYGHQAGVTGIDCHRRERPISVGLDRTARAWKLAEDTHLIFRGGSKLASADCVSCLKDDWFVTGHTDGNLCLWMTEKKKAVATINQAHGPDGFVGRGITSIAGLKGSDMVATGSNEGYLRLWKAKTGISLEERGIETLSQIPLHGFVNGIAVGPKARFCVVAVGQEPRMGRWIRVPRAKNRFGIVQLRRDVSDAEDSEEDHDEPEVQTDVAGDESSDESDSSSDEDSE